VDLTGELILAPETSFVAVGDLPTKVRDHLDVTAGFAVTRARGRGTSSLVDSAVAELLREFASRSTVVDAVLRYSRRHGLDPETVLEDSYPAFRRCLDEGYLVDPDGAHAHPILTVLRAGDRIVGGVVLRCVQSLEDSEIYQLGTDGGGLAALKLMRRDTPSAGALFHREVDVLTFLDGRVAPRLLATGTHDGHPWLAMEWCTGTSVSTAAAGLRRSAGAAGRLLDLCCRVVDAYRRLHDLGVVHGDVHPGNLIAAPDGDVRIVDFGLARWIGDVDAARGAEPPRGGAPRYLDPVYAAAKLAGRIPPPADARAEQYCLAAVLYKLITGTDHVDFALDEREMLRQTVEEAPLAFVRRGLPARPGVERLLATALAKRPADRFDSVGEFARRLAGERTRTVAPGSGEVVAVDALLDTVLARARPGGSWFADGLPRAPLASVAYGTAGLAVALYHVSMLRDDPELAVLADEWSVRALFQAGDPAAFVDTDLKLTEQITGQATPFHRISGLHAVQALISHALDNVRARQRALDSFVVTSRRPCGNLDLVLGRTGTLLGAAILHEAVGGARHVDLSQVVALGDETLAGVWAELDAMPPVAASTEQRYLGVAHGWAGFLLATLRWCATTGTAIPPALPERLDQLAALVQPAGMGGRWPIANDGRSWSPGWCNGSAGHVHLWMAAHATLRDQRWADLAERAAWDAYTTPAVGQLCCGLAGQSYALLEWHRHTGERRWLAAATELAVRAAAAIHTGNAADYVVGSLHKGEIGIAVLAADLARPEAAAMPFFGQAG
jgi:eukaryotic-like serine/threonine-protein kinase